MSEKEVFTAYAAWENGRYGRKTNERLAAFRAGASWASDRAAKRIAELEAALGSAIEKWEMCAVYRSSSTWGALDDEQEIAEAHAVLSQEKQHD